MTNLTSSQVRAHLNSRFPGHRVEIAEFCNRTESRNRLGVWNRKFHGDLVEIEAAFAETLMPR